VNRQQAFNLPSDSSVILDRFEPSRSAIRDVVAEVKNIQQERALSPDDVKPETAIWTWSDEVKAVERLPAALLGDVVAALMQ
jgi:hypothetical protein